MERLLSTTQKDGSVALISIRLYNVINYIDNKVQEGTKIIKVWNKRSNDRYYLSKINDRLLKDMGVSRIDAETEANKPFWKK